MWSICAMSGPLAAYGAIRHREFAMGAGEMSREAFTVFLQTTLGHAAKSCRDGTVAFVCMDWRNSLRAGRAEELAMHPTVKPVALVAEAVMHHVDRVVDVERHGARGLPVNAHRCPSR
jgi:hypothetical protein